MSMKSIRIGASLALAAATLLATGCIASRNSAPRVNKAVTSSTDFSRSTALETIDSEELNQLTNAFADRYRTLMEDAVRDMIEGTPDARDVEPRAAEPRAAGAPTRPVRTLDARQRALANRFLVESTTSVYDIATSNDPFSQVLDLTIMVTLTSQVWIDSDRAAREFGEERGQILVDALRAAREEVWDIAARVLLPDQLSALDFMIASWRRQHGDVEDVSFVRFDDFADSRGSALLAEAKRGGGLFEPFNQAIDEAVAYRKVLERIFFLAKRAPTLVNWQAQSVIDQVLAKDETIGALENLDSVTTSVEVLGATVQKLADDVPSLIEGERKAIFAELDRRQEDIDGALAQVKAIAEDARVTTADVKATVDSVAPTLKEVQTTLDAAQPTLAAVERLAATSERLLGKVAEMSGPPDPNAKPFDIADYRGALNDATATLVEANKALDRGESLASSPAIKGLIAEVTHATEERIKSVETAVARVVWLVGGVAAGLLILGFALAIAYRRIGGGASA
jgi:hypothetical protein